MPQHKNSCPVGHEIYNFGRRFLGHHCYTFSLSDQCLDVEKKVFIRNKAFSPHSLYVRILVQEYLNGGHEIYNFGRPFLGHHYYKIC